MTLLSVNHQHNFLSLQIPSKEREELTKIKKELEKKIQMEKAYLEVLNEELTFLKANSTVGGANTGTNLTSLKEANLYFSEKITAIKLKQIDRQATVEKLSEELAKVQNQLATLENKKSFHRERFWSLSIPKVPLRYLLRSNTSFPTRGGLLPTTSR